MNQAAVRYIAPSSVITRRGSAIIVRADPPTADLVASTAYVRGIP